MDNHLNYSQLSRVLGVCRSEAARRAREGEFGDPRSFPTSGPRTRWIPVANLVARGHDISPADVARSRGSFLLDTVNAALAHRDDEWRQWREDPAANPDGPPVTSY